MRSSRSVAPLLAVLFLACAAAAWVWLGRPAATPTAKPTPGATPQATSAPTPVTYIPIEPTAKPSVKPAATPVSVAVATPPPTSMATRASARTPAPTAAQTAEPLNAGPTPPATAVPVEAATIAPGHFTPPVIREDPNAPPRIIAMSLSTPVAHSGETVWGTVETSSNVASVEARIAGYSSSMEKVGVGKFRMTYTVPRLPFFLRRTWTIEVIARNARGDAVRSSIPITIR